MYNGHEMSVSDVGTKAPWLLLVFSMPRQVASLRVAVWRKLRRYGALALGNSGYLLPNTPECRERFEWLATTIRGEQGEASVVEVKSIDNLSGPQLTAQFSAARSRDYEELLEEIRKAGGKKGASARAARLRTRFQEIASIDFFRSPVQREVERAMNAMQKSAANVTALEAGKIAPEKYRNRVWVTRRRPGVDRVTSAWLIRKFIDPKARFAFAAESEKPRGAVPFDMYEGGFGHRGEDCTFETLLKSFGIRDKRTALMAEIVHDADLLDEKYGRKEGLGIDEVMKGWARQSLSDRELLKRGMELAEGLYQSLR
jgi:hypothetical protein